MEFNLLTCEFEGEGINIVATIKRMGKPIIRFNCQTRHMETALKGLEEVLDNINLEEAIKLADLEPGEINSFKK